MSTTFAPERLEQVIEEPFVIEGWDAVPQCQSRHITQTWFGTQSTGDCSVTATHVMIRGCDHDSGLWCANRVAEHEIDCKNLDVECGACGGGIEECWTVRSL